MHPRLFAKNVQGCYTLSRNDYYIFHLALRADHLVGAFDCRNSLATVNWRSWRCFWRQFFSSPSHSTRSWASTFWCHNHHWYFFCTIRSYSFGCKGLVKNFNCLSDCQLLLVSCRLFCPLGLWSVFFCLIFYPTHLSPRLLGTHRIQLIQHLFLILFGIIIFAQVFYYREHKPFQLW